jgi:hypothetical protein
MKDSEILRGLAAQVRAIAERTEMQERRDRWRRHNRLEVVGPLVLCFPEGAWEEILPPTSMTCKDPQLRNWEYQLRMQVWWAEHLNDDNTIDPWFNINWSVSQGDFGVEIGSHQGDDRGSYKYDSPLKNLPSDFDRLRFRSLSVDRAATHRSVDRAQSIFGDLLPVRIRGAFWWTSGLTWEAMKLVGLEELMLMAYDQPEHLHRLMGWLRDEHLHFITWLEAEGLLTDQNEGDYVGSGGVGYTDELPQTGRAPGSPARLMDRWGFAESQETVGVSPDMFEEFILPYQMPILEKFGLNYYGCCEPLDQRWHVVKRIPRLRRVSVSPWSDVGRMAELLGRDYIYCRKPNPAPVCVGFQEEVIRNDLRDTIEKAGSCHLELILKDTHTVQNDPTRLTRWVSMAREAISAL